MNKKKLSLILSIALALNTISPLVSNNIYAKMQSTTTNTYAENFNKYQGATDKNVNPNSSLSVFNTVNGKNYIIGEKIESNYENSLKFYSSTAGSSLEISKSKLATTYKGNVALEVDVRIEDMNLERNIFLIKCAGSSYVKPVVFTKDGKIVNQINKKELGNYELSKWYNVKVAIDDATKKLSVYINDIKVDEDVELKAWTNIDVFKISQTPIDGITGIMYIDNLKVYEYTDVEEVKVNNIILEASYSVEKGSTLSIKPRIEPENATDKKLIWKSSDNNIVTVDENGLIKGIKEGNCTITAATDDGRKSTSCIVNVKASSSVHISNISLPQIFEVQKGKTFKIVPNIKPENATNKKVNYISSNPNIITVDENGVITAVQKGSTLITATTEDGQKNASCRVNVKYTESTPIIESIEYDELRQKWVDNITGGNYDLNDPNVKKIVENTSNNAQTYLDDLNKNIGKEYIWSDIQDVDKNGKKLEDTPLSANITSNYNRIESMAKAYVMKGSSLKGNKELLDGILYAMDWMYNNKYNENLNVEYGNWWNWEIGTPLSLNNICMLLYDKVNGERLDKYMRTIYFYQPDPFRSGSSGLHVNGCHDSEAANRVDVSKVASAMGILTKDYDEILMARDAVETLLQYVETGDGFYSDGSFIQHGTVPYVGSYGNIFIDGILTLNSILKGSAWEIKKDKAQILYNFIIDSFEPFIYKGAALDMVRGRSISRFNTSDRKSGHAILNSIVTLAKSADEPYASHFKGITKYWMQIDTLQNHISNLGNLRLMKDCTDILNDPSIKPKSQEEFHKNFALMDRVVHRGKDYLFGVSMYSSRITNFECMNKENKRGWHTADGMTYLYNNDLGQYSTNFWSTVNPYRLPGTTIDTVQMIDEKGNKILSPNDWVGGTSLDNYGISGMDIKGMASTATANKPTVLSLEAKKSYFMFDDEIVCLGAGINSTDNRTIETIVENRALKDDNSNIITIDGEEMVPKLGDEEEISKINWAHLSGNVDNSDIGYYFPSVKTVNVKRTQNTGTWQEIGASGPLDSSKQPLQLTRNYLEMWFNHGVNPENETYEYVILPNKTKEEVKAYSNNAEIVILSNTSSIQAVKEKNLNIVGMNFWTDTKQSLEGLTCNKKASVMTKESNGYIEVAVSDTTMKNEGIIDIELNKNASIEILKDKSITVTQLSPKIKFSVNVKNAKGKTFVAKFKLK